jgi:hypothetical protein
VYCFDRVTAASLLPATGVGYDLEETDQVAPTN